MPSPFIRTIPVLRIFDIAKAREFYLDFLGFTVDFEHRFEPDLPLVMGVSLGGVSLFLSEHHGDCSPGAKVMLMMQGLAEYRETLIAKRYGYARPGIVDDGWAMTMTIADPFYNRLVFAERDNSAVQD